MKPNEAPEKIYISTNSEDGTYYISNQYKRLIEYIRKDTFIDKAAKWINEHTSLSEKLVIENFRKYMEGE